MPIPRHTPPYLYKYRCVQEAERILTQRSIRCRHVSAFNDPLDGQANLRLPPVDEKYREALSREYLRLIYLDPPAALIAGSVGSLLVGAWRVRARTLTRSQIESEVREAVAEIESDSTALERRAGATIRGSERGPMILCLSEIAASIPMWQHYAQEHKGIVVAFDCQTDPQTMFSVAEPVQYSRTVPQVCDLSEWIRVSTGQMAMPSVRTQQYFTKSDQWAYEQEWRFAAKLGPPGGYEDLPLVPKELGGIVLGLKTNAGDANRLAKLAKAWRPECSIWQARLDYSSFGLLIDRVS